MGDTRYTSKVLEFVLFCVEMYAQRGGVSGSVVMKRFDETGVLTFLRNNYEVLHTQGRDYILSEIDQYLSNRGIYNWGDNSTPAPLPESILSMPEITQDNFRILLPGKIAKAVFLAAEHSGEDCFDVAKRFYASPIYHELERETSKYWWLSPEQLEAAMVG